jgi:hypothetical protein
MNKSTNYSEIIKSLDSYLPNKLLRVVTIIVSTAALIELALTQFAIKMTRLSAAETTGIALFAFIIFGMVTLFAVSRMKDSFGGKVFAVIMNFVTGIAAVWYLRQLFADEIFFRNLYYVMNRRTQTYEILTLGGRIAASIPLVVVILGAAVYFLSGLAILLLSPAANLKGESRE